jgi:hypothetical protein
MKNLSRLSAMAITSALTVTSALAAGCSPKCRSKCRPAATRCAPKCGAKYGARCGAAADPKLIKRPAGYRPNYPSTPAAIAAQTYGVKQLHLDEAIQVCMVGPMAAKPLPWKSAELANLVAFMEVEHKKFSQ